MTVGDIKRLDESIRKLADTTTESIQRLNDVTDRQAASLDGFKDMMDGIKTLITTLNSKYEQLQEKVSSSSSFPILPNPNQHPGHVRLFQLKLDFPKFFGDDPEAWIYKCEKFFELNAIEETQKLRLASLHMEDKAMHWYRWFEKSHTLRTWREFSRVLLLRFGDNVFDDATGQLTKLKQWTSVKLYQEKFEELANKTTGLSEEFFISCFVSGLKDEIKGGVQMFQPRTISQAMGLAHLQEDTIEAVSKKHRVPMKAAPPYSTLPFRPHDATPKPAESGGMVKRISPKDFDERRAKGLCFGCDEKYFRGQVCKKKQLYMIDVEDEEEVFLEAQQEITLDESPEEFHISVHALSGVQSYKTMRIKGVIKQTGVNILIDSGSTHNFLDPGVAKRTGVRTQPTNPLSVIVADGTKISSKAVVRDLHWSVQGMEFISEVRLLPLGGCDMVLGVQWLSTLGPVLWDFKNLQMQFSVSDKEIVLKGDTSTAVQVVNAKKMQHLLNKKSSGVLAQLCSLQTVPSTEVPLDLLQLLQDFHDVFREPNGLPPFRAHDHQIPLKPDDAFVGGLRKSEPANVRGKEVNGLPCSPVKWVDGVQKMSYRVERRYRSKCII
ncbi:uncharacterized protein LOC131328550 [Rhododendron vialii]|uniref:uncharacterized protein LOC131328550 n=1 Tax=Rhododendron vialii TaxID=182163 RepID=UPI00265EC42A|nr:uncharacterized protein LOC131328550 [Rhododendron vialii]